jgi:TRAP-type C4-dicarboxylate transport system substrate-binding protein
MHFTFVTEFSPASLPAQAVRIFAGIFNEPDEPLFNVVPLYDWEASSLNILKEVSGGKLDGAAILADHGQYAPSDGGDAVSRYAPNLGKSASQSVASDSIVLLANAAAPAGGLWTKRAITSIGDLQSARVCAFDVESSVLLRQLGAEPVTTDWSHVRERVAAKEIDAVLCSGDGAASLSLSQNFRYFSAVRYPGPACALLMSARSFTRLSTTQQNAVRQAGRSVEHQLAAVAFYQEQIIFENMHDLGVHVDSRPSAELSAAFAGSALVVA